MVDQRLERTTVLSPISPKLAPFAVGESYTRQQDTRRVGVFAWQLTRDTNSRGPSSGVASLSYSAGADDPVERCSCAESPR